MAVREEIILGSKADTRGFKKAESAAAKLTKQVKSLGAALGVSLGTAAVVSFGKAAVKSFQEAEKSNVQLANSVKNLGFSFAQSNITNYLDKISASSGIAGETLNTSFQALLNTTGSFLKSQELLNLALDVSAGSSKDLVEVSNDLGQAYVGNTKGLRKYNLGLTQGQLKSAKFAELQAKLNKQFGGSNQTFLATYAGKMQVLTEAAGNAQEIIGGGLVDSLGLLAGQGVDDIEAASEAMAGLATSTANVIRGQAKVLQNLSNLGGGTGGKIGGAIKTYFKEVLGIQALEDLGKSTLPRPTAGRRFMGGAQSNLYNADAAAEKKFRDQQKKFQDAQLLAQKKAAAEKRKELALKKAGTIFDVDQAGILAALQGKITQEERKRLELQFALLTGNVEQAKALTFEIAKAQGLGKDLASYLASLPDAKNPFESWANYLDMLEAQARRVATMTASATVGTGQGGSVIDNYRASIPQTNVAPLPSTADIARLARPMGSGSSTIGDYLNVTLQIDGKTIASALQDTSLSGIGSSVNRTGR
jgi:hypothetical protein